jgi:hypothetical protein
MVCADTGPHAPLCIGIWDNRDLVALQYLAPPQVAFLHAALLLCSLGAMSPNSCMAQLLGAFIVIGKR